MGDPNKQRVKDHFGRSADAYATSSVHAKGGSLIRLLELVDLDPSWKVLDIATGGGHMALAVAPLVDQVVASDLTYQMLQVARRLAAERKIRNFHPAGADAERLPFPSGSFDLVTCRIAAHHFPDIPAFISESNRVLANRGILAVVDNVVPGDYRNRREAKLLQETGRYINAFGKLRDPSHVRTLSPNEWKENMYQQGLRILHNESSEKQLDFDSWTERMNVVAEDKLRLKVMLQQAPSGVKEYFKPQMVDGRLKFNLTEFIIIGAKDL
jgi:ubiquinone/menaquinone biosynthesis C-methylase UbiE